MRRLLALIILMSPAAAQAQEPTAATRAKAKRAFDRAEKLYRVGDFVEALESYRQAYQLLPAPDFLFNIGQCHRNLGNHEQAIFSFEQYLKDAPKAEDRERVRALIRELENEREKSRVQNEAKTTTIAGVILSPPPVPIVEKTSAPIVSLKPPPVVEESRSIFGRWWFWALVGTAAVAAGTAVVVTSRERDPAAGSLATFDFR